MTDMPDLAFDLDDLKRLIGAQAIEIALLKRDYADLRGRYDTLVQAIAERQEPVEKSEAAS